MTISKIPFTRLQKESKLKKVSWAIFEKKYLAREDQWKYEWVNGIIEKTKRTMYPHHYYILYNLRTFFTSLFFEKKVSGSFEAEIDIFLQESIHRRPDMSYFTEEQCIAMAHDQLPIPQFIIEVVSSGDTLAKQNAKMKNYREADIKVIWQIFPETQEVIITRGKESITCFGEDICSAHPIIPSFEISIEDIFRKPKLPKNKK